MGMLRWVSEQSEVELDDDGVARVGGRGAHPGDPVFKLPPEVVRDFVKAHIQTVGLTLADGENIIIGVDGGSLSIHGGDVAQGLHPRVEITTEREDVELYEESNTGVGIRHRDDSDDAAWEIRPRGYDPDEYPEGVRSATR